MSKVDEGYEGPLYEGPLWTIFPLPPPRPLLPLNSVNKQVLMVSGSSLTTRVEVE